MGMLIRGEQVILKKHISRIMAWKYYILFIIMLVLAFIFFTDYFSISVYISIAGVTNTDIAYVFIAIGMIALLVSEIKVRYHKYYLTNMRVVKVSGILKKSMDACPYNKIVNVKLSQSLPQRIVRIGTIDITTFQRTEILIKSVSNPGEIENKIYEMMGGARGFAQKPQPSQQPQQTPYRAQQKK